MSDDYARLYRSQEAWQDKLDAHAAELAHAKDCIVQGHAREEQLQQELAQAQKEVLIAQAKNISETMDVVNENLRLKEELRAVTAELQMWKEMHNENV
jgi:hypothetical protein